jgi:SAM-dependent methyltransferase/uncharacterized protein YbaR (Trm112 family)
LYGRFTRAGGYGPATGVSNRDDRGLNNLRRRHFDAIRPVCPVCRNQGRGDQPLVLAKILRESEQHILEGILLCPDVNCQREFPILDGIPIIVSPLRTYVADNVFPAMFRTDLSEEMESLLGDCSGPGSTFDVQRQLLSAYTSDHYWDRDTVQPGTNPAPASIVQTLHQALPSAGRLPLGPMIDLGCSVGRTTFELAGHHDELALGVDLNFSMLRLAAEILRTGRVRYPRRRVGVVYDRREFSYSSTRAENVDILALPFAPQRFSIAVALNVLDCVSSPLEFLQSTCQQLCPGGKLILTTPFDWSTAATPVEGWLGGHSQRSVERGASDSFLRKLFTEGTPGRIPDMSVLEERMSVPWQVRLHERAVMSYSMSLFIAEKQKTPAAISQVLETSHW